MTNNNEPRAMLFDVEYFGTKDGPGIRTVVFFKGCNLACQWCHNPESHRREKQLLFHAQRCVGCLRCVQVCVHGALGCDDCGRMVFNGQLCKACGACVDACVFSAREITGTDESLAHVKELIQKDKDFFVASGGGVTLSGGEPMLQRGFVARLTSWLRDEGIHVALETAGCYPVQWLEQLIDRIDLVYIDLKHVDPVRHAAMTGRDPSFCHETLEWLLENQRPKTIVRIPVVPGFNHDRQSMQSILGYLAAHGPGIRVELLPYHDLGSAKYRLLSMSTPYLEIGSLGHEDLLPWRDMGLGMGLNIRIGTV